MQAQRSRPREYGGTAPIARQFGVSLGDGLVPPDRRRGRGAPSNATGRFEPTSREAFDDGWERDEAPNSLETEVIHERPRTIITRNESPDISFDRSINPYRGCEHGCVYCFARPTHAYMGLSAGLDFESKLFVKDGAAGLLERELAAPNYRPRTIALGSNTDPYQPIERQYRVTRSILEALARHDHPVGIVTKSNLVLRDLDLLAPMAAKGLAKVYVSVTTLDRELARRMEPRAPTPGRRLEAIERLAEAGVPTGVMVAPIVPAVNDSEIEAIMTRAHAAGAREAGYVMLRLPLELRDIFREWLLVHYPDKLRHSLSLVQSTHGGKDYDSQWGKRMAGSGPYAWMIGRRFEIAARRLGFNETPTMLRCDLFHAPESDATSRPQQLSLF
jgi:DNA repair photolyase